MVINKKYQNQKTIKKLGHKMIGSYKIKKLVRSSYQLDLPTSMKIYDVFYSSLLRKTSIDPLLGQHIDSVPPVIVDDKEKSEVNNILDARKKK